ncbi:TPA: hypothetical protein SAY52_002414 [Burkholderia cenocepacia]|uniref:hypothetical protein n=1 Tax=unclassified Burkholderia TaxID=2613784 RepID=UPI00158AF389|nr:MULTISPECIES: hypothetical protein [unclassified Burkholderia]HEF5871811.1 hypothetical protein [Burkholderia cenocepacia]
MSMEWPAKQFYEIDGGNDIEYRPDTGMSDKGKYVEPARDGRFAGFACAESTGFADF